MKRNNQILMQNRNNSPQGLFFIAFDAALSGSGPAGLSTGPWTSPLYTPRSSRNCSLPHARSVESLGYGGAVPYLQAFGPVHAAATSLALGCLDYSASAHGRSSL